MDRLVEPCSLQPQVHSLFDETETDGNQVPPVDPLEIRWIEFGWSAASEPFSRGEIGDRALGEAEEVGRVQAGLREVPPRGSPEAGEAGGPDR